MTPPDLELAREIFGAMLRNAQALEDVLTRAALHLPPTETAQFTETLQRIHVLTMHQTALVQQMQRTDGTDRRQGQRRSGIDRRQA